MVVREGEEMKKDCFGYKLGTCTVLTEPVCKDNKFCSFYKTKEQFNEDAEKARQIVERKKNNVK